jgi:hypothetical protein
MLKWGGFDTCYSLAESWVESVAVDERAAVKPVKGQTSEWR